MATERTCDIVCDLIPTGTLELRHKADPHPWYKGLLVSGDMIMIADCEAGNVQIYRRHDGKYLAASHKLDSPSAIFGINDMEIGVILMNNKIEILSLQSVFDSGVITCVRTLHVYTGFVVCYAAVKFMDTLFISGDKKDTMCWCRVSLTDGHVEAIYQICKGYGQSYLTIKNKMIYISCQAGHFSPETGLWAYNIQNPSMHKFRFTHPDLKVPSGVTVDTRGFIFVCNEAPPCIYQLTDKCELVNIYKEGMPSRLDTIFWDQHYGQLYITSNESNVITQFRPVYSSQIGNLKAPEVLGSDARKLPVTTETFMQTEQGFVDKRQSSVETEMYPSVPVPENSEGKEDPIVPVEILRMDSKSLKLYKKALQNGKEKVYNIRVMVVGQFGVGKTTLIKRLLGQQVDISERKSTEGIDVYKHCCKISLDTGEWTVQHADTEQDYQLQRLARVLSEKLSVSEGFADEEVVIPSQGERTLDGSACVTDEEQDMSSAQEGRSPASNVTYKEHVKMDPGNDMLNPCSNAYVAEKDPMKEMLKLLQENANQLKQDKGKVSPLSVWDFAGQYSFYTTHQTFLTRRAIYLLVSDVSGQVTDLVDEECFFDSEGIRKCRVYEITDVWLNSIHSCASSPEAGIPPVILVGTHVDKIAQNQKQLPAKGIELNRQRISPATERFTLPTSSLSAAASTKEQTSSSTILRSVRKIFKTRKKKGSIEANPVSIMTGATSVQSVDQPKEKRKWRFWQQKRKERFDADSEKSYSYELCKRYFREIRSYLRDKPTRLHLVDEDFAIDNTVVDCKLEDLKRKIVEVASQQPYWGEEIPSRWLPLEQELMKLKAAGIKIIPVTLLEDLNKYGAVQIATEELDLFLRFHHDIGTILYFCQEVLKEQIMLDPHWMIDALKSLITAEMFVLRSALGVADMWCEFKQKGKLFPELIDAVWSKKNNPDFHDNKELILLFMEKLNIIAKPRYYCEDGSEIKVESYYLAPCMLSERTPTEVISLAQHPEMNSSSVLCYVFQGKFLPTPIFHRLLATCVARWPIAKRMSENLIFCGCCVFNIDLHHRLTMLFRDYVIFAQVKRMGDTEKNPSFELCIDAQKFITMTLSSIIGHLGQSLQFDLFIQCPKMDGYHVNCLIPIADLKENEDVPCHFHETSHVIMSCDVLKFWFQETEESDDSSAFPMPTPAAGDTDRFMRLTYLLVDVGSSVLRQLLSYHTVTPTCTLDQYLAKNRSTINSLLKRKVLHQSQMDILFPPNGGNTNLEDYDVTLLYALFNNIVPSLTQQEEGMIKCLREDRNKLYGHAKSCKMNAMEYQTCWNSISSTLITLSQQCGDPNFQNEISQEIQRIQVSAIPTGSYLDILKTWFSTIETVKGSLETAEGAIQALTSRVEALELKKTTEKSEGK